LSDEPHQSALGRTLRRFRPHPVEFWALRDVSFQVGRGETLGIIGDNGAGKSTLLKLLSGVTSPTSGRITVRGRMSALIEVGSGFHPELTGRENVYLSGSILGMRRSEITEKLDRIIDFAGVRRFIETPVKRYSSGMYLRLGFSIAAHLEPDILLLDEVLAVGDAEFQAKCLERIDELHRLGRTIVFISHDLAAVERLCRRVLLLHKGKVIADGPAREVIHTYSEMVRARTPTEIAPPAETTELPAARVTAVDCLDETGRPTSVVRTGERTTFRVHYEVRNEMPDARIDVYAFTMLDGRHGPWCHLTTGDNADGGLRLRPGPGVIEFSVNEFGLLPGECQVWSEITHRDATPGGAVDWQKEWLSLQVEPGPAVRGTFYLPHRWRVGAAPATAATHTHDNTV
jgi:lipopolysaccharide transport system ATP-binding protein